MDYVLIYEGSDHKNLVTEAEVLPRVGDFISVGNAGGVGMNWKVITVCHPVQITDTGHRGCPANVYVMPAGTERA